MQKIIIVIISVLSFVMVRAENLSFGEQEGEDSRIVEISSSDELATILSQMAEGHTFAGDTIVMTADIAFPMVSSSTSRVLDGTFLGNGHSLTGVNQPLVYRNNGHINGLTLETSYISGGEDVAPFCIYNYGTISDCTNNVVITASAKDYMHVAGIASYNYGDIINSKNNGNITCTLLSGSESATRCGGITAFSKGNIIYCENTGNVTTNGIYSSITGGIVGDMQDNAKTIGCTNRGNVKSIISSATLANWVSSSYKFQYTGGIVGQAQGWSLRHPFINRCKNYGEVSSNYEYVGGIAGKVSRTNILNVINGGNVVGLDGHGYSCAAGIAGYVDGIDSYFYFMNCINHGTISAMSHYDSATSAGIAMNISKCKVGNCMSDGSISASSVGGVGKGFQIATYEYEDCEILNTYQTPEEVNSFLETFEANYGLLKWTLNSDLKIDFLEDFLTHAVATHGSAQIFVFPESSSDYVFICAVEGEDAQRVVSSTAPFEIRSLQPETLYVYEVQGENYSEKGSFQTLTPVLEFSTTEITYDAIEFIQKCTASGVDDMECEVEYNDTVIRLDASLSRFVIEGLDENTNYSFSLSYTLNGKRYKSNTLEVSTLPIVPSFSLIASSPYSLILKCENAEEIRKFNPQLFVQAPLYYTPGEAIEGEDIVFELDEDDCVVLEGLQYDYTPTLYGSYNINGATRMRELDTFKTGNWGGEGIIQLSQNAAMVHALFGGLNSHIPNMSSSFYYDNPYFIYKDALSSESDTQYQIDAISIDDGYDYAATIPLSSPLAQYYIRMEAKNTYYGKHPGKDGEWQVVSVEDANVEVVQPMFFKPRYANEVVSFSFIEGEEAVAEVGLIYKVETAEDYIDCTLSYSGGSQVIKKSFTTLVASLNYIFKFYAITSEGQKYSSQFYRLSNNELVALEDYTEEILPSEISLSQSKLNLFVGQQKELQAALLPSIASNTDVVWSSEDDSIATVDDTGLVSAVSVGSCDVIATTCNGHQARCTVNVNPIVCEGLALDKTSIDLFVGEEDILIATFDPEDTTDKTVYWCSLNEEVASVDEEGIVYALSAGETVISATSSNGVSAECRVRVNNILATSISLDKKSIAIEVGQSEQLVATILPENATIQSVQWKSSDEEIAVVSSEGVVTAHHVGEAIITALTIDGSLLSAECSVNAFTGINGVHEDSNIEITSKDRTIVIRGAKDDSVAYIYDTAGNLLYKGLKRTFAPAANGIYIVIIETKRQKVVIP